MKESAPLKTRPGVGKPRMISPCIMAATGRDRQPFRDESVEISGNAAEVGKLLCQILQPIDDQMGDAVLLLQLARGKDGFGQPADAAIPLPDIRPDDQVGAAGFIFDGHEGDPFRSSRALAYQNQPGDAIPPVGLQILQSGRGHDALGARDSRNGLKGWPRSDSRWA